MNPLWLIDMVLPQLVCCGVVLLLLWCCAVVGLWRCVASAGDLFSSDLLHVAA